MNLTVLSQSVSELTATAIPITSAWREVKDRRAGMSQDVNTDFGPVRTMLHEDERLLSVAVSQYRDQDMRIVLSVTAVCAYGIDLMAAIRDITAATTARWAGPRPDVLMVRCTYAPRVGQASR